jgi:CHAD domain-containing protein
MAKAREIPGLDGRMAFDALAREAVTVRAEEVFEHAEDVLNTDDIERVHAMRVATRRLRAVLEVFAPAFDPKAHKKVLKDVKVLADALGARRDPDVQLAALDAFAGDLDPDDREGLDVLAGELRAEQLAGNADLAHALERMRKRNLAGRLRALAGADAEATGATS